MHVNGITHSQSTDRKKDKCIMTSGQASVWHAKRKSTFGENNAMADRRSTCTQTQKNYTYSSLVNILLTLDMEDIYPHLVVNKQCLVCQKFRTSFSKGLIGGKGWIAEANNKVSN